jgi:plastocyanin
MRRIKIGIYVALVAILLSACSPATESSPQPASPESQTSSEAPTTGEVTIEIKLFNFPDLVEVPVGGTVTWINQDGTNHSVTNGTPEQDGQPEQLGGVFDSGFFGQSESFSFTFTEPGDYPYFCMRHNHMQGIIRVVP